MRLHWTLIVRRPGQPPVSDFNLTDIGPPKSCPSYENSEKPRKKILINWKGEEAHDYKLEINFSFFSGLEWFSAICYHLETSYRTKKLFLLISSSVSGLTALSTVRPPSPKAAVTHFVSLLSDLWALSRQSALAGNNYVKDINCFFIETNVRRCGLFCLNKNTLCALYYLVHLNLLSLTYTYWIFCNTASAFHFNWWH